MKYFLNLSLFTLLSLNVSADSNKHETSFFDRPFTAHVVRVIDGDSLEISVDGSPVEIRLFGVDAPELHQPQGKEAKKFMQKLALDRDVQVTKKDLDEFHRVVAIVKLGDGKILNAELLRAGFAWWIKKYAKNEHEFEALQKEARKEKRGIWSDKHPTSPWSWRATHPRRVTSSVPKHSTSKSPAD